jgi:pimeloyl-ACP methyl ester carboxylesterase
VWLAGGPGGAAASDDARFAQTVFLRANRTRDIVLVDQRGVGRSTPLLCPSAKPGSTYDAATDARSCLRGLKHDPRLFTTDAAMDDVDDVRAALGYSRIVLYGGSYGATAAQVYLARHGSRVSAAVLDGATLLDVPIWERMPRSTQAAFDVLRMRCAADDACNRAFPDPAADLAVVLAAARHAPLAVPGPDGPTPFDVSDVQDVVRTLLRSPAGAARLPLLLRRGATGDLAGLVDEWLGMRGTADQTARMPMYWAIRCAEGWSRDDPGEIQRLGARTAFLEAALADARGQALVCDLLGSSRPAPDTGVVPRSRVPVLFLVGGTDPQDPAANVAQAKRSLPNAEILIVPGGGHGTIHLGCVSRIATRFFGAHRVQRADRRCAAAFRPPPFVLS